MTHQVEVLPRGSTRHKNVFKSNAQDVNLDKMLRASVIVYILTPIGSISLSSRSALETVFKVNTEELQKILSALTRNFTNIFLSKLRAKAQVRGSRPHYFVRGMCRTTAAAQGHCPSFVSPTSMTS